MSSCTLTDRQSPTLLSVSSGLSGNSTEPSLRTGWVWSCRDIETLSCIQHFSLWSVEHFCSILCLLSVFTCFTSRLLSHYTYTSVKLRVNLGFLVMEVLFVYRASTLMLEGVKRVWGKEGYLPQKESSETSAVVDELNSVLQSSNQEVATHISQPEPEPPHVDQEKQQLASSLFVGLGSQNAASLVGLL